MPAIDGPPTIRVGIRAVHPNHDSCSCVQPSIVASTDITTVTLHLFVILILKVGLNLLLTLVLKLILKLLLKLILLRVFHDLRPYSDYSST